MQFSAMVNRFIVKTLLDSTFTNDLKRKEIFSKMFIVADFLAVPRGCLWFVIVVFPDHTHLIFLVSLISQIFFIKVWFGMSHVWS